MHFELSLSVQTVHPQYRRPFYIDAHGQCCLPFSWQTPQDVFKPIVSYLSCDQVEKLLNLTSFYGTYILVPLIIILWAKVSCGI